MDEDVQIRHGRRRFFLCALLVLATLTRLYHLRAPLLDQMHVKQVFNANKARNIARSPRSAWWSRYDFLDAHGERMMLVEEVPVYAGLVGISYSLFGEQEWLGRAWSILATLIAIVALYDLLRREYDEETGLVAACLFALSPLMIFYGRAVFPDPWMLACMLLCAGCYRRYLDEGERARCLASAAAFGLLGAAFKYYGLLVLIPLADMAYRRGGWRRWSSPGFLLLASVMILPIAGWLVGVFAQHANPSSRTSYFFFQEPQYLLHPRFFQRLTLGLFVHDLGPVTALLVALGACGAAFGRERVRPLLVWTVAGFSFVFLFAPKFLDHDYYGLMILPAAAGWGAIGWRVARRLLGRRRGIWAWGGAALLGLAAVIHSPLVMGAKFSLEWDHAIVAARLNQLCPPTAKVVVLGQRLGWPAVHYSGRTGWVDQCLTLPPDWRHKFQEYHALGAELVAVYFDPTIPARVRATYLPMLETLPLLEHRSGPWFRGERPCEYYILSLRHPSSRDAGRRPGRVASAPAEHRVR